MQICTSSEYWLKILNANPYFGAPLSEQEIKHILMAGILLIHLETVDEKGHADINLAWYYYDSSNNKLYACFALNESPKYLLFLSSFQLQNHVVSVSYYLS
jgi:hypothetical protein